MAEFDENIPLDQEIEKEKEPEASKAEQEINLIIEKVNSDKSNVVFIDLTSLFIVSVVSDREICHEVY